MYLLYYMTFTKYPEHYLSHVDIVRNLSIGRLNKYGRAENAGRREIISSMGNRETLCCVG